MNKIESEQAVILVETKHKNGEISYLSNKKNKENRMNKIVFKLYYGIGASKHYDDLGGIKKIESGLLKIFHKHPIELWRSYFNKKDKSNRNTFPIIGLAIYNLTINTDETKGKQGGFDLDLECINASVKIAKEKLTKVIIKKIQRILKTKAIPELHYCIYCEEIK